MPNWVTCNMGVTGPQEDINQFKQRITNSDGSFSLLDNLLPTPQELYEITRGWTTIDGKKARHWRTVDGENVAVTDEENQRLMQKYGAIDWYDWNVANYGCKWNEADFEITDEADEQLECVFVTPWSPPMEGICAISKMFPGLTFYLNCVDESYEWAVEFQYSDGELEYNNNYTPENPNEDDEEEEENA